MSRDLTAGFLSEVSNETITPALLIDLAFDGGTVRFWTGIGDLTWNSNTYTGSGDLLQITPITETDDTSSPGLQLRLSGLSSSLVSSVLSNVRLTETLIIRLALFNSSGAIISDPNVVWQGFTDVPEIMDNGTTLEIVINAESRLIELNRVKERRYTSEDQKDLYSGDKGLDFVTAIQEKEISWGSGVSDD